MPPRGVKKGTKRARQYEKIKQSQKEQGRSEDRAEEIAARTVNKERARSGESRTRSRTSTQDISSSRRGGQRSGTQRAQGPHARPALQRGQEAERRGPLEHEQVAAAARRGQQEALNGYDPMKAVLWDEPFSDPGWIFERKLDGVRCLAHRDGGGVRAALAHRPQHERRLP